MSLLALIADSGEPKEYEVLKGYLNSIDREAIPGLDELLSPDPDLPRICSAVFALLEASKMSARCVLLIQFALRYVVYKALENSGVSQDQSDARSERSHASVTRRPVSVIESSQLQMALLDEKMKNQALTRIQNDHQNEVTAMESEIAILYQEKNRLTVKLAELKKTLDEETMRSGLSYEQLSDKYEEAVATLKMLTETNNTLREQMDTVQADSAARSDELIELRRKNREMREKLLNAKEALTKATQKIEAVGHEKRKLQLEVKDLMASQECDLLGEIAALKQENTKLRQQNVSLVKANEQYASEILSVHRASESLSEQLEVSVENEDRLQEAHGKIDSLIDENEELLAEMQKQKEELKQQAKAMEQMSQEMNDSAMELKKVEEALEEHSLTLDDVPALVAVMEENDELKATLSKTNSTLDALVRFTTALITTSKARLAVFSEDTSLVQDDQLKEETLSILDECRAEMTTICGKTERIALFDAIFDTNDPVLRAVHKAMTNGQNYEYASFAVLLAVIGRLQRYIRMQNRDLADMYQYLPVGVQKDATGVIKYLRVMKEAIDPLRELVKRELITFSNKSDPPALISQVVEKVSQYLESVENVRNSCGFKGDPFAFPMFAGNALADLKKTVEEMKEESSNAMSDIKEQYEARIESIRDKSTEAQELTIENHRLSREIERMKGELKDMQDQIDEANQSKHEVEQTFAQFHEKNNELEETAKLLMAQRDRLQMQFDSRIHEFQRRLDDSLQFAQAKYEEDIERLKRKHADEQSVLVNRLEEKTKKLQNDKKKSDKTMKLLESALEKSKAEVQQLMKQNEQLRHRVVDEDAEKVIAELQDKITDLTIQQSSDILNSSFRSASASAYDTSLATEIGNVLSEVCGRRVTWTRSKILATVRGLVDRAQNSPEQNEWTTWAISLISAKASRGNELMTPTEMRATIRDLVLASNSFGRVMDMVKSLRLQKKILLANRGVVLSPRRSPTSVRGVIRAVLAIGAFRKRTKRAPAQPQGTPARWRSSLGSLGYPPLPRSK